MEWVDVRAEMPWLGPPPFWLSHANGSQLRSVLTRLEFDVFEVSIDPTTTEEGFRRAVAEAMDLAHYAWKNWDAFVDAFGDLVRSTTKPIALIWLDPAHAFIRDLETGLRLYSTLASILGEWNRVGPECHQVVLFLQGDKRVLPSSRPRRHLT